jgi:hypothetical protein
VADVTIIGKVLLPSGVGPRSGRIVATLSENSSESGNKLVGRKVFHVPDGGDLALASPAVVLRANDGMSPANTFYEVEYSLVDADGAIYAKRELWQISGSGTQSIGNITVLTVPLALIIGQVPLAGADYPAATVDYRGALRRRKRAGRAEEIAACLGNLDLSVFTWKELADGEP